MGDSESMDWKSSGSARFPSDFAVMLTHSSLSSRAAAVKLYTRRLKSLLLLVAGMFA